MSALSKYVKNDPLRITLFGLEGPPDEIGIETFLNPLYRHVMRHPNNPNRAWDDLEASDSASQYDVDKMVRFLRNN